MYLDTLHRYLLYNNLGHGNLNTSRIIFLGNEPGLAASTAEQFVENLKTKVETNSVNLIGETWRDGFLLKTEGEAPVTSVFVQFIARLMMALREKEEYWFYNLTFADRIKLNNYILTEFHKTESSTVNIRPLPRPTEDLWIYQNVSEKGYKKEFDFSIQGYERGVAPYERFMKIKKVLELSNREIIIGVGDKRNKELFFKYLYPDIEFKELIFSPHRPFLWNKEKNIVLSDYFDNRSGIKLEGLRILYQIIRNIEGRL